MDLGSEFSKTEIGNENGTLTNDFLNSKPRDSTNFFLETTKRVNTFVDYRTELLEESSKKVKGEITQEGSSKRAGDEMEQERSKKQKVEDDKESEELKKCLEIIPDDGNDVTINATPLSSKAGKGFSGRDTPLFPTMMIQAQEEMGEEETKSKKSKRKNTELPQTSVPKSVADEVVNTEMDNSLERVATTATSLDAEQDKGGGPRRQEAMSGTVAQTSSERVSKISNDPLLAGINTPRSREDSLKINELMELCTNLQNRVLDLETTKTTQAMEIESLKRRVPKLKKKQKSRTYNLKRLYKVGLSARVESSKDKARLKSFEDEALGEEDASKQGRIADIDSEVFVAQQDENVVEKEVDVAQVQINTAATTPTISIDKATLAQALAELKQEKPKAKVKGIVFHKPEESTTTAAIPKPKSQDKGKDKMIEEPVKKFSKKDQTELLEESSKKVKAEITQEGSSKRAGDEMEQERSKKQKVEDDKESEELKKCLEIIPDDGNDVTINATPLSSNKMLKNFDREDLEVLWRLVKDRFEKVKPVDNMDTFLLHNLKTVFEYHVKDNV
nr:hypothetical protein [Tanacetum cinerariifolium]